jgi:hypothetical protein
MEQWRNDVDRGTQNEEGEMVGKVPTEENQLSTEKWWNDTEKGNRSTRDESASDFLYPPQILHSLTSDFTHTHSVRGRRLTTCATVGPHF